MKSKKETLFLIDTSSYLFRAYHALPYLSNSKGVPTNATLGFTNMILKILREHSPDYISAVLDSKAPTKRDKIFAEYKATRPPTPEDLKVQISYILEIIKALGINVIEKEGYEADDIIATIVEKLKGSDLQIVIVTGDKDMFQLISDNVLVLDTMKNVFLTPKEILNKYGIPPHMIPELLALTGDSVDNIPGVRGVGMKTAQKLLKEFCSIENILKNINEIKQENIRNAILESEEQLKVNKLLVNLDKNIDIQFNLDQLKPQAPKNEELRKIFIELEFFRLLKEFLPDAHRPIKEIFLRNDEEIRSFIQNFSRDEIALTMSNDFISIALDERTSVTFRHNVSAVSEVIKGAGKIYLYDLKSMLKKMPELDAHYQKFIDIKLLAYLLNPNYPPSQLETIIIRELGAKLSAPDTQPATLFDNNLSQKRAGEESCLTLEAGKILHQRLISEELDHIYNKIELPLVKVLKEMEEHGILVDRELLLDFDKKLEHQLTSIKSEIYASAGEEFNIDSPKQLQKILFEKLNLRRIKKTKTGFSTDSEVLEALAKEHPLPAKILQYRSISKIKNTYIQPLLDSIDPATRRVHPTFHQDVVATGRLSCSSPNLQNIPAIGELATELRRAFIADKNMKFISADYSQIELRLLAHLSRDEGLISSFKEGKDIHSATASVIFNINEVTPEMRRKAKAINFGIIYGMSSHGLSQELKIPYEEAEAYIQEYFLKYPGVKRFIDETIEKARRDRFVKTIFGRKRPVPDILSPSEITKSGAERVAINSIMQGSAADITKIAMLKIHKVLKEEKLKAYIVLQIHDELILEVEESIIESVKNIVKEEMESVIELAVPLIVNLRDGRNWAEI